VIHSSAVLRQLRDLAAALETSEILKDVEALLTRHRKRRPKR